MCNSIDFRLFFVLSFTFLFLYSVRLVDAQIQVGLDIDAEMAYDRFGFSVSQSANGSRVAIGASSNDDSGSNAGHVRVFELIGGVWSQLGDDIDGEAAGDESGTSVSLSDDGSRVAIGAIFNDDSGSNAGHVRVFELIGGAWSQLGDDLDGEAAGDAFGTSVTLSADGNRVAVGARLNAGNGSAAGHVRVFELLGGGWTQLGGDIDGEAAGDVSGTSVSLSADGSRVAIGARNNADTGLFAGHVRIFELVGGAWTQLGGDIDGEAAGDGSGESVSFSADGNRVAIGARLNDGTAAQAGHVRVFELIGGAWSQLGGDIDGEAADDFFGFSVSLSADGNRIAIGAYRNDGAATDAGHVRVFDLVGETWTQVGTDIDGEAEGDQSGWSVVLSDDGSHVAVGAIGNNLSTGLVKVYNMDVILPVELRHFEALVVNQKNVLLSWDTSSETNNSGFFLESSTPDEAWQERAWISGSGSTREAQSYSYQLRDLAPGPHAFRLKQVDFDGVIEYSPVVEIFVDLPGTHFLSNAFPNPFNPRTSFSLAVAETQQVLIALFNQMGQRVRLLQDGPLDSGLMHRFSIDASGLPSGSYFYRITGEGFADSRSVVLMK